MRSLRQMPFKIEVADLEQRVDEEDNGVVANLVDRRWRTVLF